MEDEMARSCIRQMECVHQEVLGDHVIVGKLFGDVWNDRIVVLNHIFIRISCNISTIDDDAVGLPPDTGMEIGNMALIGSIMRLVVSSRCVGKHKQCCWTVLLYRFSYPRDEEGRKDRGIGSATTQYNDISTQECIHDRCWFYRFPRATDKGAAHWIDDTPWMFRSSLFDTVVSFITKEGGLIVYLYHEIDGGLAHR